MNGYQPQKGELASPPNKGTSVQKAELSGNIHFGLIMLSQNEYNELIKQSDQLRTLKNYIKQDGTITKNEILNLINAMEANNE